ncbi:hypothetical protein N7470_009486 [Penicillium chermesinum]|nr:hypothetical protein N7470_009486 [Penicillium chermesinum]
MASPNATQDGYPESQPPTVAAFSPSTISGAALTSRQRSSVIVHRKSPLLVATPPPITRALAYSHPFLLPLNSLVGLLTWTTGDAWQSFLLVATFWVVVLINIGNVWAAIFTFIVLCFDGSKHLRKASADSARQQKSLDDIVDTLRTFTTRCNMLLGPLIELTDFLSTQRTATSATTRPALTALFLRIILITPVWIIMTLPPFYLITTRRIIMIAGTIILTYHSRPARVSRVILWRSRAVRRLVSMVTGLSVSEGPNSSQKAQAQGVGLNIATKRRGDDGVRFTFVVYENQRRWLGIGWTYSLFPSERSAWTDEHLDPVPSKDSFELPDVRTGDAKWRWVEGSEWRVEGAETAAGGKSPSEGWIYYDNKWNDGRRGQDGWDRYTRRRKWFRDAELVEVDGTSTSKETVSNLTQALEPEKKTLDKVPTSLSLSQSVPLKARRRRWFSTNKEKDPFGSDGSSPDAGRSTGANATDGAEDVRTPSRPISSRKASSHGREGSDSSSFREKEMAATQDHLDKWGTRATGGTERAEREFGLSDEVNMGLS